MIAELLALLVCAIVGVALVRRVAGEALLVGIGAGAGVLFVLSLVGVPWTRASSVACKMWPRRNTCRAQRLAVPRACWRRDWLPRN